MVHGITDTMDIGLGGLWELVMDRDARHAPIHEVEKSPAQLSKLIELNIVFQYFNNK